jgi:hypothetical protein
VVRVAVAGEVAQVVVLHPHLLLLLRGLWDLQVLQDLLLRGQEVLLK